MLLIVCVHENCHRKRLWLKSTESLLVRQWQLAEGIITTYADDFFLSAHLVESKLPALVVTKTVRVITQGPPCQRVGQRVLLYRQIAARCIGMWLLRELNQSVHTACFAVSHLSAYQLH